MGGNHNTIMDTSSLGTVMEFNEIHEENHYLPPLPLTPYCETPHREALPKSNFLFGWDLNLAAPVDDPHDHTNTILTPAPRPHPVGMDNRGPLTFWSPSTPGFTGPGQTLIPQDGPHFQTQDVRPWKKEGQTFQQASKKPQGTSESSSRYSNQWM
ncbi:hypothetical protein Pyn_12965 [Prunus yedoensis var. nudiflora]|uniref:Uncharacterized protein n=1 Tax=Prunus yedoensis var. nudiflora TaxID=2094558 RepID=A0A314UJV2_PRUYE|nr:hypothetical protein Pyn_12965 [Prunus yedoensis var. nudiflora]